MNKSVVQYKAILVLLAGISFVLLTGCASAKQKRVDAGFKMLTGPEIATVISGKKGVFVHQKSRRSTSVSWGADGSQAFANDKLCDTGEWRIVGDKLGSKWKVLRNGREVFNQWIEVGANKYEIYNNSGSIRGTLTME